MLAGDIFGWGKRSHVKLLLLFCYAGAGVMECRYSGTNLARKEAQIPLLSTSKRTVFDFFEVCAQAQSSICAGK